MEWPRAQIVQKPRYGKRQKSIRWAIGIRTKIDGVPFYLYQRQRTSGQLVRNALRSTPFTSISRNDSSLPFFRMQASQATRWQAAVVQRGQTCPGVAFASWNSPPCQISSRFRCTAAFKLMPWPWRKPTDIDGMASVPSWVRSFVRSAGKLARHGPMTMDNITSLWRYDAGADHTLEPENMGPPAILRCAHGRQFSDVAASG